jgi:predicted esterase
MKLQAHGAKSSWGPSLFLSVGVVVSALAVAIATGCAADTSPADLAAAANGNDAGSNSSSSHGGDSGTGTNGASQPGSGDGTGDTADGGGPLPVVCSTITAGTSKVTIGGKDRQFLVQLPTTTSGDMALLFLWHGWMQAPNDFESKIVYDPVTSSWLPFDPNAFKKPLMIVTPYDQKLIPPWGLDWDIVSGAKDFPYFDAMLQCINAQFTIDKSRIYSFGFSAGAVFTDLLSAQYPHLFAATISESGAWFSDQPEWADVSIPIMTWKWPALNPADRGNVLLTHGGENDYATVISLEKANQQALPYLKANERTVVECAHTFGHTLDPDLTQEMYYEYLWDHTLGGPVLTDLIPDFPTTAKPLGATSCTFHPAQ